MVAHKAQWGLLEPCLLLSLVLLIAQLAGPAAIVWWRERPRPGQQTPGHVSSATDDGNEAEIQYLIYLPRNYTSNRRFPLLLFLHGSGERGDDLNKVAQIGPPALIANGKGFPLIVISPQCPANSNWDVQRLIALLDRMEQKLSVDPDRVYVAGYSMGGYGTWTLASTLPGRFAAAIPVSGGSDVATAIKLLKTPIWAFHGAEDKVVPLEESKRMVDAIQSAGGTKAQLTILDSQGHNICDKVFSRDDLWKWLLAQHRLHHGDETEDR